MLKVHQGDAKADEASPGDSSCPSPPHKLSREARFRMDIEDEWLSVKAFGRVLLSKYVCPRDKRDRFTRKMLQVSLLKYQKEFDLFKFVKRQRYTLVALLSLLSGKQAQLAAKLSYPVLRESTDTASESDGTANVRWSKDGMKYLTSMQVSGNPVDSRALSLFKAMRETDFKDQAAIFQIGRTMMYFKYFDTQKYHINQNQCFRMNEETSYEYDDVNLAYQPYRGTVFARKLMEYPRVEQVPREFGHAYIKVPQQ